MNKKESRRVPQVLIPYLRCLHRQTRITAALWGFCAGAAAFAAVMILCKLTRADSVLWPLLAAGIGFIAGTLGSWALLVPDEKETARLLDATGLQERAATMLDMTGEDSEIVRLQRADAENYVRLVNPARLKKSPGLLLPLVALAALMAVMLSLAMPGGAPARTVIITRAGSENRILALLSAEKAYLTAQGESLLTAETEKLINSLPDAEGVLEAAGMIAECDRAAEEAARSGHASPENAAHLRQTLKEVLRELIGDVPESEIPPDPAAEEDLSSEGARAPESSAGEDPSGEEEALTRPGGSGEEQQSRMTEPVYDPISGAVQYGDVFSAYYAGYLQSVRSGEIPGSLLDAAKTYFQNLSR